MNVKLPVVNDILAEVASQRGNRKHMDRRINKCGEFGEGNCTITVRGMSMIATTRKPYAIEWGAAIVVWLLKEVAKDAATTVATIVKAPKDNGIVDEIVMSSCADTDCIVWSKATHAFNAIVTNGNGKVVKQQIRVCRRTKREHLE